MSHYYKIERVTDHRCPQCLSTLHTHYELPTGHGASLEIEGVVITSHIASAIKEASYRHKFIRYVTQKAGWPNKTIFHTIDWGGTFTGRPSFITW